MKSVSRSKTNYGLIVIIVLLIAVAFGFVFDLICTGIEMLTYPKPEEYASFVEKYSLEYGVPENLIYAVIKTESGFDSSVVSKKGAVGLMQLMPATFEWLTKDILRDHLGVGMLYDPETNIKYGTYYLSRLYNKFGDWDTALAAYNCGEGKVAEWLVDSRYSADGKKLIIKNIPSEYKETKNYVNKVNTAFEKYKKLYTEE